MAAWQCLQTAVISAALNSWEMSPVSSSTASYFSTWEVLGFCVRTAFHLSQAPWVSPTGMGFCSSPTCKNSAGNGEVQAHTDTQNLPPMTPREMVSISTDAIDPADDIWSAHGQYSPLFRAKAPSYSGGHALISFPNPSL